MEIWSEQIRLQDARMRAETLRKAFEPIRLERPDTARTPRQRRRHPVIYHRHVPAH